MLESIIHYYTVSCSFTSFITHIMQGVAFKEAFVWLVPMVPTHTRGGWSTAVMECGELSTAAMGLTQKMVKWCVEDLESNTLVSLESIFIILVIIGSMVGIIIVCNNIMDIKDWTKIITDWISEFQIMLVYIVCNR